MAKQKKRGHVQVARPAQPGRPPQAVPAGQQQGGSRHQQPVIAAAQPAPRPGQQTRQQRYLRAALEHAQALVRVHGKDSPVCKTYGHLCHTLPVMVRVNGLCQALAFVHEKAEEKGENGQSEKPQAVAYKRLREHVAATLGLDGSTVAPGDLLTTVMMADVGDYMRYTRVILESWVYYKRFAASVLDVPSGEEAPS